VRHNAIIKLAAVGIALVLFAGAGAPRQARGQAATKLFNGWSISPAGQIIPLEHLEAVVPLSAPIVPSNMTADLPLKMIVSPDGKVLLAACAGYNATGLAVVDLATSKLSQFLPEPEVWNGLAFSRDGKKVYLSGGDSGKIYVFDYKAGKLSLGTPVSPMAKPDVPSAGKEAHPVAPTRKRRQAARPEGQSNVFLAGIAVHPGTGTLYVANEANDDVWVLDPETLARTDSLPTGLHPHSCVFGGDGVHLYVSDWGSRSVSIIDTRPASGYPGRKVRDVAVGVRPNDMVLARDGRLFVACSGDNTVHVIPTQTVEQPTLDPNPRRRPSESAREILGTSLYPASPEGSTPDALAVAPDGKTLYVANADNNDVMVVNITEPGDSKIAGFIPVGWYPTALAVSPDSGTLLAANGKGVRSRPSYPPLATHKRDFGVAFDHPGKTLEGSIEVIARPDAAALARYTRQVKKNSPYAPQLIRRAAVVSDCCIPDKTGGECPIKYVLYIIKENRTYDQVFGDFKDAEGRPAGNGDPALVMYGENVTPNHHQLARDYVLLDNFYCNGEVSVDGHDWCDGAIVSDFKQRAWIMHYSEHGTLPGNDEMATPAAGYLWDLCRRNGATFKCYGEGASRVPKENRGTWKPGRDMNRVQGWIDDLHAAEKEGALPQLAIMSLGEDHTAGTSPGKPTPEAAVGSNDVALGKIVEAASRSRFWKEMAILVVEDDAQNGPDHVDCHRTAALVLSPWAKRGAIDSTHYTQAGMVRTIELILGLPAMTQYDAAATPMFGCFRKNAELIAYQRRQPKVDLNSVNTLASFGAKLSATMDFDEYDRADENQLNRILWAAAKGAEVPYPPAVRRANFGE
jgi:YVTN family beta-propeller protein